MSPVPTVPVELGFLPPAQAIPDPDHPGLLRAGPRAAAPYGDDRVEFHACGAVDLSVADPSLPDLATTGIDTVDLSGLASLQAACGRVLAAGRIDEEDAAVIRSDLDGAVLECASGQSLAVRYLAGEGFIMRAVGPARMPVVGPRSTGMNDHGGATSVHADQDVFGTPLAQLMDGRAPDLFRHDSPDGANRDADLMLVNLWIPLRQVVQPLVLADGTSIDRPRHQLRFGLPTASFLERDEDMEINDIWAFLHDDGQRWYFRSDLDHRSAWVFDTLSTPHGAGVLPGEAVARQCLEALDTAAVGGEDASRLLADAAGAAVPPGTPPGLCDAVAALQHLCAAATDDPGAVRSPDWTAEVAPARERVVRRSLEMRLVVSLLD